jgi:hypothetical protein
MEKRNCEQRGDIYKVTGTPDNDAFSVGTLPPVGPVVMIV